MEKLAQVGRIAFREEGNYWNAYYALPHTMEGALHLGSIQIAAVMGDTPRKKKRKTAFINMMRSIVTDVIQAETGIKPEWPSDPQPAPEHERAGHS